MRFPDLIAGGPVPRTPWNLSLLATMQIDGRHAVYTCRPCRQLHRDNAWRSGCIPALPYPPDDDDYYTFNGWRSKKNMINKEIEQPRGTAK